MTTISLERERARPLPPEDRRSAILDAVIPLLLERGREVSTREMARAAGVAEGTLFRAFGDKESLLRAAAVRHWDPRPFSERLRESIDPDRPTDEKVRVLLELFIERFQGTVQLMTALKLREPPTMDRRRLDDGWPRVIDTLFRPEELAVDAATVGYLVRLFAFGAAVPDFGNVRPFDIDELSDLILHGVAPRDAPRPEPKG